MFVGNIPHLKKKKKKKKRCKHFFIANKSNVKNIATTLQPSLFCVIYPFCYFKPSSKMFLLVINNKIVDRFWDLILDLRLVCSAFKCLKSRWITKCNLNIKCKHSSIILIIQESLKTAWNPYLLRKTQAFTSQAPSIFQEQ